MTKSNFSLWIYTENSFILLIAKSVYVMIKSIATAEWRQNLSQGQEMKIREGCLTLVFFICLLIHCWLTILYIFFYFGYPLGHVWPFYVRPEYINTPQIQMNELDISPIFRLLFVIDSNEMNNVLIRDTRLFHQLLLFLITGWFSTT